MPALVLRRDHATTPSAHRDGSPVAERVADLELADALPDGRLVHRSGAGHHVVHTARDAALVELRAFLGRLGDDTDQLGACGGSAVDEEASRDC